MRRRSELTYATQAPTASPVRGVAASFVNLSEVLLFGTTTASWERRCAASLAASRRRRAARGR